MGGSGNFHGPDDAYNSRGPEISRPNGCNVGYRTPVRTTRRIANYCNSVVKKTSRIGRNVGNFIRTYGPTSNRTSDENANERFTSVVRNGIVPINDYRREIRSNTSNLHNPQDVMEHGRSFGGFAEMSNDSRTRRYINENTMSNEELATGTRVIEEYHRNIDVREYRRNEDVRMESHAVMRLDRIQYEQRNSRGRKKMFATKGAEWDLERMGYEAPRLHSSLPKRGRSRYRRDDYSASLMGDPRARSVYPKSMQDLTDLDIERILERDTNFRIPLSSFRSSDSLVERYRHRHDNSDEDSQDNYLTLYKSLSSGLENGYREKSYIPGRVHYEREYRIYGKDTLALIYYKTCYL